MGSNVKRCFCLVGSHSKTATMLGSSEIKALLSYCHVFSLLCVRFRVQQAFLLHKAALHMSAGSHDKDTTIAYSIAQLLFPHKEAPSPDEKQTTPDSTPGCQTADRQSVLTESPVGFTPKLSGHS